MKIARVLVLVFFLVSAFTGAVSASAPAAGADRAVGFVQLLSRVNPNVPVQVQAQDAFDRVRSQLLAAQRRGQIVEFELSARSGVVKILYRPSMGPLSIVGKSLLSSQKAAADMVSLPKQQATQSRQAGVSIAADPYFGLSLFDSFFRASNLTPGAKLVATMKDATGRILATYSGTIAGDGTVWDYFHWSGSYTNVLPGNKVKFQVKDAISNALLATYTATAPAIKFTSVDKTNSIVKGTGPAGKPISVYWYHNNYDASYGYVDNGVYSPSIPPSGAWTADLGTTAFRGHDYLDATVYLGLNFGFDRSMYVPYLYCELGSNYCVNHGIAGTAALTQVVHGGVTYKDTGKFSVWSDFYAEFAKSDGTPIFLKAPDKVSGTGVAVYPLPNLTATIDYVANSVSGKVVANKYFWIDVYDPASEDYCEGYAHADSLANYSFTCTSPNPIDLVSGEPYAVEIWYQLPTTGNVTDLYKSFGP